MLSIQSVWKPNKVSERVSSLLSASKPVERSFRRESRVKSLLSSVPSSKIGLSKMGRMGSDPQIYKPKISQRWYARPRKGVEVKSSEEKVVRKASEKKKAKVPYAEDAEEILEGEMDGGEYVGQPFQESEVPEDVKGELVNEKLPNNRITFNYKTYRYKDLQMNDPDRITHSFTLPAGMGSQVRAGESIEPIIHTKENPGEDLSKDLLLSFDGKPIGLDSPVTSFISQMTQAIYDVLKQERAEDIVVIDIDGKTNWVPTMIIATANSARHCVALASTVAAELKRSKLCRKPKVERNVGDEWVIVATGTTILEIMTPENREHMDLERLWVLKKSAQETFEFDEEEERFMYDEEDGMWDDDDPDF